MKPESHNQQQIKGLIAELKKAVAGEVRFDTLTRNLYSTDASDFQKLPVGVVIPKDSEDVSAAITLASQYEVPIIPRGGGSSLSGQTIGTGLIIDHSKYMNRIIEVNADDKWVEAESGVVLDVLNSCLLRDQLMVGPDPSSSAVATLGGMAGNNSTGSHSIKYGMFADHIKELEAVLSDGNIVRFKEEEVSRLDSFASQKGVLGAVYQQVPDIINRYQREIETGYPNTWRNVAGYGLDRLQTNMIRHGKLNLASLIVGSEGTLAGITKLKIGLVPRPNYVRLMILNFDHQSSALAQVPRILEFNPSAVELMSYPVLKAAYDHPVFKPHLRKFVDGLPKAVLIVEFSGIDKTDMDKQAEELEQSLRQDSYKNTITHCQTSEEIARVWQVRKSVLGLLMSKTGDDKLIWVIDDATVPVDKLVDYTSDVVEMGKGYGIDINFDAHASAGCLHMGMNLNLRTEEGLKNMEVLSKEIMSIAIAHQGTTTGEHGEGLARSFFNEQMYGPELHQAFKEVKAAFDPKGLFNPLKIVDFIEPWNTDWLLYHPNYKTPSVPEQTYFDYSHWGGIQKLVEMCNGQGICRAQVSGTMCPSYRATLEEKDSTRGRANTLRNAMTGYLGKDGFLSEAVKEALDLCLECKACREECSSRVDMAKLKSEFLALYQERHGTPLRSRLFAMMPFSSRLGSKAPRLFNALYRNSLFRGLLDSTVKIDKRRELPLLAHQTFKNWFENHKTATGKNQKQVLLWDDCHLSYHEPNIGVAAVEVLEAAGYDVLLPEKSKCCGRPMISKGLLKEAKTNALHNVAILATYAKQGIPIIGVEPSCIATMRDEYPGLLQSEEADLVAENAFFFEEFMVNEKRKGQLGLELTEKGQPQVIKVHTHCYQKAFGTAAKVIEMLGLIKNATISEINSGCCGMAGSFGYEKEHYDISMEIGELSLFPVVRNSDSNTIIAAAGTSCRQQIKDGTSRKPLHPIEILASALK